MNAISGKADGGRAYLADYPVRMGSHCSSHQMRELLERNGLSISEDLCFGIGAGLGFIYRKTFDPPLYFVLGRSDELEEKLLYHLGGMAMAFNSGDNAKARDGAFTVVRSGQPALVNVDASCFSYMREKFDLFEHARYGGHRVAIIGYDFSEDYAWLADYAWPKAVRVGLAELEEARASDAAQTPPDNLWYEFAFPAEFPPLAEAVIAGIALNVRAFTSPWFEVFGLPGLGKFCGRLLDWRRTMRPERLRANLRMVYMMFETVGTGGGNFRRIYSRFLSEASEIVGDERLARVSKVYAGLAGRWKEPAHLMLESSEDDQQGLWRDDASTRALLDAILADETAVMGSLGEIVDGHA